MASYPASLDSAYHPYASFHSWGSLMAVKRQNPVLPAVILALFLVLLVFLLVSRKSQAAVNNKDAAIFSPSSLYFEACLKAPNSQ